MMCIYYSNVILYICILHTTFKCSIRITDVDVIFLFINNNTTSTNVFKLTHMWCVVYHSKHIYSMFKRNVCYTYAYILYPKKEVECEKVIAWDI